MSHVGEFSDLLLPFGQDASGRMVAVNEVERGAACGCVCPQCKTPLIAKKGDVIRHHFAHSAEACGGALETALHKMAKQIIVDAGKVWVPRYAVRYPEQWQNEEFVTERGKKERWYVGKAEAECQLGVLRLDVRLKDAARDLGVEIYVTHPVPMEKRQSLVELNYSTIEIDISGYPRSFDIAELTGFVLHDAPRFWLHHSDRERLLEGAQQDFWVEYQRRDAERKQRKREIAESWGRAWDARNTPEARLAKRRAQDFAEAARIEAEKSKTTLPEAKSIISTDAWIRVALMRPPVWEGRTSYPTKGAFCSACDGRQWHQIATGWACARCAPDSAMETAA